VEDPKEGRPVEAAFPGETEEIGSHKPHREIDSRGHIPGREEPLAGVYGHDLRHPGDRSEEDEKIPVPQPTSSTRPLNITHSVSTIPHRTSISRRRSGKEAIALPRSQ
jgi:hypothetical protein